MYEMKIEKSWYKGKKDGSKKLHDLVLILLKIGKEKGLS